MATGIAQVDAVQAQQGKSRRIGFCGASVVAFEGFIPPYEATLTTNLKSAGAIILAKTMLSELANFIAQGMPGNYNGLGGQGLNAYDPRRDPRPGTNDGRPAAGTGDAWAVNLWMQRSW